MKSCKTDQTSNLLVNQVYTCANGAIKLLSDTLTNIFKYFTYRHIRSNVNIMSKFDDFLKY